MNYEIIFYHSGKTAETERLIEKYFGKLKLKKRSSGAAVSPAELAAMLGKSLKKTDVVVIIGGLDGGKQSTDAILSSVLSSKGSSMECEKLLDDDENISYMLSAGRQSILVFPDETEIIGKMLEMRIMSRLKKKYSLTEEDDDVPSFESVKKELERQLEGQDRAVSGYASEYVKKEKTNLNKLKLCIVAVAALGVVLMSAAVILLVV